MNDAVFPLYGIAKQTVYTHTKYKMIILVEIEPAECHSDPYWYSLSGGGDQILKVILGGLTVCAQTHLMRPEVPAQCFNMDFVPTVVKTFQTIEVVPSGPFTGPEQWRWCPHQLPPVPAFWGGGWGGRGAQKGLREISLQSFGPSVVTLQHALKFVRRARDYMRAYKDGAKGLEVEVVKKVHKTHHRCALDTDYTFCTESGANIRSFLRVRHT